ncbi:MAG: TcpQ domain-containing protein [Sedimenticola sp.]
MNTITNVVLMILMIFNIRIVFAHSMIDDTYVSIPVNAMTQNQNTIISKNIYNRESELNTYSGRSISTDINAPLIQYGTKIIINVTSRGTNLQLSYALKMLFPDNWKIKIESEDVINLAISWHPGTELTSLLSKKGISHQIAFVIDWNSKHVWVGRRPSILKVISNYEMYEPHTRSDHAVKHKNSEKNSTGKKITSVSSIKDDQTDAWHLSPGRLKPQLEKWGQKANYDVIWMHDKNSDLLVDVGAHFTGSFLSVINEVLRSYRAFNVDMTIEIFPNKPKGILMIKIAGDNS